MPVRHFLSTARSGHATLSSIIDRAVRIAQHGVEEETLSGKVVGVFFKKSSTRTRTSFTVGALKLGAKAVTFGPNDLQLSTGETLEDTGRVLSGYLDALVIRTNEPTRDMEALACQDRMAVINAMSEEEHPTQAICDLSTMKEHFGRLEGLHVLYVGEGNNSASALARAISQIPGMKLTVVTPEGFGLPASVVEAARRTAEESGAEVAHHHDVHGLPTGVDVVYATRWMTMGVPKGAPGWEETFRPLCVTREMMDRVSKGDGSTIFLHDLPAVRGQDVTDEVLDGPRSLAWRQAEHKMFGAMAVMEWAMLGDRG